MKLEDILKIRLQLDLKNANFASIKNESEFLEKSENDPCEEGYMQLGTKIKDGRQVPNCIPIPEEMNKIKEGFPIPSPNADEDEQKYISRCMGEIGGEYEQTQALAICYAKWIEK